MAKQKTSKTKPATPPAGGTTEVAAASTGGASDAALEEISSQSAYRRFLPAAQAIDARDMEECRADVGIAYHNAKRGHDNVLALEARVEEELPKVSIPELRSIAQLAQAVVFAALQVNRDIRSDGTFGELYERALRVRRKLLKAADSLAESVLIPQGEVDAIKEGKGKRDAVNDCVSLAALFRKYEAAIAGKSPVTKADVVEADAVGSRLQTLLKPKGTKRDRSAPVGVQASAEIRDRLWTLLLRRWDQLWRAGAVLFGRDEVDEKVPPLRSRELGPRKKDEGKPK